MLLVAGLAAGGLALGAVWWGTPAGTSGTAAPVVAPSAMADVPAPIVSPSAADRATAAPSPPVVPLPASAPESVRPAAGTVTMATERERQARERRAQTEREKASPRITRPGSAPPREPQRPDDTNPATSAAAPATPAVAVQAPTTGQTVDQSCADSSNFLTRDFCRVRACRNPAMAGDPVCVRFREMEATNRSRAAQ